MNPMNLVGPAILGSIAAAIIAAGGAGLYYNLPSVVEGWRSSSWPVTAGTMLAKKHWAKYVESESSRKSKANHVVELRYAYDVGGRRYEGDREQLDRVGTVWHSSAAEQVVSALPAVGARFDVRYDPHAPERSLMHPGAAVIDVMLALFGAAAVLGGGWLLQALIRSQLQWHREMRGKP